MNMYNIRVSNNKYREVVTVPGDKTVREVFEQADIAFEDGQINFNGSTLRPNEIDKTLEEFELDSNATHFLSAVRKESQAATAIVAGSSLVITSDLTKEDFDLIEQYAEELLTLKDGEEKKYTVTNRSTGDGGINQFGAVFGRLNAEGKPTITVNIPDDAGDLKAFVKPYGKYLMYINAIEAAMCQEMEKVRELDRKIEDSIVFH